MKPAVQPVPVYVESDELGERSVRPRNDDNLSPNRGISLRRYNAIAHNWAVLNLNRRMVERHLALFHGDLLDIGCGEKPYEDLLLPRVSRYVGLDHLDTQHSGSRVDVWGDAAALPFGDNEFDAIAAFQVLEHVPEPSKVLTEAYRVLRPGGGIYISTPFMWGLHELPHDYFRYTPAGLHHLVSQAGFSDIKVKPVSGYWLMAGLRFSYYVHRFARGPLETLLAPLMSLVQCIALALDFLDRVESDSIGYVTTAAKPFELVAPRSSG